jgi:hypothetical protein
MAADTQPTEFYRVAKVFDEYADDLLDVSIPMNNKMIRAELQHLLSLGEAFDNPNAIALMADKLPAMLVAFGLEQISKEEQLQALNDELDLFIQQHWQESLEKLITQVSELKGPAGPNGEKGEKIAASLKPAPVKDGIRADIILNNRAVWDDLNARKTQAERWVKQLTLICKGIELRGRLLNSQLNMSNSMVRSGISR